MILPAAMLGAETLDALDAGLSAGKRVDEHVLAALHGSLGFLERREPWASEEAAIRMLIAQLFTDEPAKPKAKTRKN